MNYSLPGLYRITCITNGKVYIGETSNVLSRARVHIDKLAKNENDVNSMQADYNNFGFENFSFHILFIGSEWAVVEKRKQKEIEILLSYNPEQVYNKHPNTEEQTKKNYRVVCEIHGILYQSIYEAAKITKEKEELIRTKLYNNYIGHKIIEKVVQGYTPIIVNQIEYDSIQDF